MKIKDILFQSLENREDRIIAQVLKIYIEFFEHSTKGVEYKYLDSEEKKLITPEMYELLNKEFESPKFVRATCLNCGRTHIILVDNKDYEDWSRGKLIQNCFPYLEAGMREMFLSGLCPECFKHMKENSEDENN